MRARPAGALLLLVLSCSDPTGPHTDLDVAGEWQFSQVLSNDQRVLICGTSGPMSLEQHGGRFTATGQQSGGCFIGDDYAPIGHTGYSIRDGTIDGAAFRFTVNGCPYVGRAYGERPDSIAGTTTCRITVAGAEIGVDGTWSVIPPPDTAWPTLEASTFGGGADGILERGDDTLFVRLRGSDDRVLRAMGYELRGEFNEVLIRDSVLVQSAAAEDTLAFPLDLNVVRGSDSAALRATVFAHDSAGHQTFFELPLVYVHFPPPPEVAGHISGMTNDTIGAGRDTLEISVSGSAQRPLRWLGYRLTNFFGIEDSVAVDLPSASHIFRVPIPTEWKDQELRVTVFVRDRLGFHTFAEVGRARVTIFPSRQTRLVSHDRGIADVVVDPRRPRAYLATAASSGPDAGTPAILPLDLESGAFLSAMSLPVPPTSVDLSAGGDSLIVLASDRLHIVNLTTLAHDSSAALQFGEQTGRAPTEARVAANGQVLIGIAIGSYYGSGQVLDLDLATGAQSIRTDAGAAGMVGPIPILGRSGDHRRVLLFPATVPDHEWDLQVYDVSINAFLAATAIPFAVSRDWRISGNVAGDRWLFGNILFDAQLAVLQVFGPASQRQIASVLSSDGSMAFVSVPEGVIRYRASDGAVLERILLPHTPLRLYITADAAILIAIGGPGLMLVDLR